MAHDVFISYSNEDKPVADAVCAKLEQKGIRCWIAPRDATSGVSWAGSIVDAIDQSRIFVLVFSSWSNRSEFVIREVKRAVSKGIPTIPFRIEDVPLSKDMQFFIELPHWLDAMTPPLERHIDHLVQTVEALLSGQSVPPPPAPPRRVPRLLKLAIAALVAVALLTSAGYAYRSVKHQNAANEAYRRGTESRSPEQAIMAYSEAIRYNPKLADAYMRRGLAYEYLRQPELALRDFGERIKLTPRDDEAYVHRGHAYHGLGTFDSAVSDYTQAINLKKEADPSERSAAYLYGYRGRSHLEAEHYELAEKDFSRVLTLAPSHQTASIETALMDRGYVREKLGRVDQAIADYTEAIARDPRNPGAYNARGIARRSSRDIDGAIADLSKAIDLDQYYWYAYGQRALTYLLIGDDARAREDFRECDKLDDRCQRTFRPLVAEMKRHAAQSPPPGFRPLR